MTPYEQGWRDAIAAAAKLVEVKFYGGLAFADAIRALKPEDDPGNVAFYRVAQTGVEPALPPPATPAERAAAIVAQPHPSERGVEKLPPSEVLGLFRTAAEQMTPAETCTTCGGTDNMDPFICGACGRRCGTGRDSKGTR